MPQLNGQSQADVAVLGQGAAVSPYISIVVPIYNERDNVEPLLRAISDTLDRLPWEYEVVLVDDGSDDGTRRLLRRLVRSDPRLRVVMFSRNYGQTAAMSAGFDHAQGDVVVTMDGDLQNDPADIPRLVDELHRGFDIVCGWRKHRKDRWLSRLLPSRLANFLISRVTGVPIHDTGCSLKVYRGWVVRSLNLYSDMHRFIAALAVGVGARISELPVRHHARQHGSSKYGLTRTFKVLVDLIVVKMLIQFSAHPVRWFLILALPLFFVAPVLFVVGMFKFENWVPTPAYDDWYVIASVVCALVAVNVFLLGLLAETQLKVSSFFSRRADVTAGEVGE